MVNSCADATCQLNSKFDNIPIKFDLDPSVCTLRHTYFAPRGSDVHGSPSLCTYNSMPIHGYEEGLVIFLCEKWRLKLVGEKVVRDERR